MENNDKKQLEDNLMESKRVALIASVMAILPGWGQIYNGQKEKGMFFFASFAFVCYFFSMITVKNGFMWLKVSIVVMTLLVLVSMADAFFSAKRLSTIKLNNYNKWYLYILFLIPWIWAMEIPYNYTGFKPLYVWGESMFPTLEDGEMVVTDKRFYVTTIVKEGEVISFVNPNNENELMIKRAAAVPKDKIVCNSSDGKFYVNDIPYKYHYFDYSLGKGKNVCDDAGMFKEEYIVKEREVVVLGDNYYNSEDSRSFGPIDWHSVRSKVNFVLLSKEEGRTGLWVDDYTLDNK